MPILRRAVLALFWAIPSGAVVLQTKLAPAPPVVAAPAAPAELALRLLTNAALVLPQTALPDLTPLTLAVPARAETIKPIEPAVAARAVKAALPVLQSAAPLSALKPDQSAALLSKLFDSLESEGVLGEPAPVTALDQAAANTGLDAEFLAAMAKHSASKGLVPVEKFLRKEPLPDGGYLLGTTHRSVYSAFASATGLTHFAEVYQELYGRVLMDATDKFLDFITSTGDKVVFLVPPKALEHPGVTSAELGWFLAHPERMANVSFVFGAYEFLSGDLGEKSETERALELWRGGHARAPDERRLEQRRRHRASRGEAEPVRPEGDERAAAIESFLYDMQHAYYGKDRGSTGRFFFQGSHGTRILHRAERGLFLEYSTPGGGWAEIFVSKRAEPELYRRLWLAYLDAS